MFRKDLTIEECARLIDMWEGDRCADGEENVFDLQNRKDFKLMVGMRGFFKTRRMLKKNRFWFDGLAYNEPKEFPTTAEEARQLAESMIGKEYVRQSPKLYAPYVK